MVLSVNEQVNVITVFSPKVKGAMPYRLRWKQRVYCITKLGLHHSYREGRVLFHIYEVTDGNLSFRLKLNTENLLWFLEAVSDGTAD